MEYIQRRIFPGDFDFGVFFIGRNELAEMIILLQAPDIELFGRVILLLKYRFSHIARIRM
jgi:hypothetical protein